MSLFKYAKKINFIADEHIVRNHRAGWRSVTEAIVSNLHIPYGVSCYSWLDRVFRHQGPIGQPWIGFLHNVVDYPEEYERKYKDKIFPLRTLVNQSNFLSSLESCRGILTLSQNTADFLTQQVAGLRVQALLHPCDYAPSLFQLSSFLSQRSRQIVTIGQWMRRYHSLLELKLANTYKKIIVTLPDHPADYHDMWKHADSVNTEVKMQPYLCFSDYDQLLQSSLIFLDFYDVAASNTLLEGIMANNPMLVRKLPATVEYLGADYPLFFSSLDEAESLLANDSAITAAHYYLSNYDKSKLTISSFLSSFENCSIYQALPFIKL